MLTGSARKVGEVGMKEYIMRYENEVLQLLPNKIQPLVRCKDCKHGVPSSDGLMLCNKGVYFDRYKKTDWFCADGERRDDQ